MCGTLGVSDLGSVPDSYVHVLCNAGCGLTLSTGTQFSGLLVRGSTP